MTLFLCAFLTGCAVFFFWRGRTVAPCPPKLRILREIKETKLAKGEEPSDFTLLTEAFECTLLRMKVDETTDPAELANTVARYGGILSHVNRAECVCYFRDQGEGHSAVLALSAARDLRDRFGEAAYLSLVNGFVRLKEKMVAGAPVMELNRLAPEAGQILVTERVAKFGSPLVKFKQKGNLVAYAGHGPFAEALARCGRGIYAELDAYRADNHLVATLGALGEWQDEIFTGVVRQLRQFSYHPSTPSVAGAFAELLRAELQRAVTTRISSLIAVADCFFTSASVDADLRALFLEALASEDKRVKANTIELFIHLYPHEEIAELKPYVKSPDHRVSANMLIKLALQRFDEKVVRSLYGRVRGGSVAHVASALFAIGEIARHYHTQDPGYLRSKLSFLRLFDEIPFWARHPNPMVRRQAVQAAKKLDDPKLNERLRSVFAETEDAELLSLFADLYGWRKDTRRSG